MAKFASYAWLIETDHLCTSHEHGVDPELDAACHNDAGEFGPRNANPDTIAKLRAGEGKRWRCKDGDGEVYYTGRYIGPDSARMFGPLEDFGAANAGATTIEYLNEATNEWEVL